MSVMEAICSKWIDNTGEYYLSISLQPVSTILNHSVRMILTCEANSKLSRLRFEMSGDGSERQRAGMVAPTFSK